eukprot:m.29238 g.29238  ORF g.29238 m.29238 type:complete len:156 (-) comp8080_c0_seq1:59-526(-)
MFALRNSLRLVTRGGTGIMPAMQNSGGLRMAHGGSGKGVFQAWDNSNMNHKLFFFARLPRNEWTSAHWREEAVLWFVFAVTGSSASKGARLVCNNLLGIEGTIKEGPWTYRASYFVLMMPVYTLTLLFFGTMFRRHYFYRRFAHKMWSRMLPGGR